MTIFEFIARNTITIRYEFRNNYQQIFKLLTRLLIKYINMIFS
jgi:hypothetical protein